MANIVNTRIDERLVHGQIVAFWTNRLNASRIMVIDDTAASNDIQKAALKMACPAGTKLSILRVERAVEKGHSFELPCYASTNFIAGNL